MSLGEADVDLVLGGTRDLDAGDLLQLFLLLIHVVPDAAADRGADSGADHRAGARVATLIADDRADDGAGRGADCRRRAWLSGSDRRPSSRSSDKARERRTELRIRGSPEKNVEAFDGACDRFLSLRHSPRDTEPQ